MSYIIAIDQGTTGTTAALIDANTFEFLDKVNHEFPQIYPEPGLVEHCLNEIWATVEGTITELLEKHKIDTAKIKTIGITNQRETTCAFDKEGKPLANAIVWQDRRTSEYCAEIRNSGKSELIQNKTGLPTDPYFSATKMRWLLKNNNTVSEALKKDNLLFGTIDTFLLYKLTGNITHATDATNASRTLLFNLETGQFDDELLNLFEVSKKTLPEVKDSFGTFGITKGLSFLPDGISITGILGDQQSALFGQAGIQKGDIKCTYGTGAFILLNTGNEIYRSKSGLLSTIAYRHAGKDFYALEGSTYIAGAAVQWLRDNLNIIEHSHEVEQLAESVSDISEMKNILFLPFFTGIGSPYWNAEAKAAIIGLTRDSNKGHIARACLEGIAFSINDLVDAMAKDTNSKLETLKVDGGAVANDLLMTLQANISELKIIKPKVIETTAYGAALAAAIGSNLIDFSDLEKFWKEDKVISSQEDSIVELYRGKKKQWTETIKKLF